jgi:predicted dehydrogenase
MTPITRRSFLSKLGLSAVLVNAGHPPVMGKKLNIALCGLGRYAGIVAYGLESSLNCKLAGIVTGTPSKATEWQKKYAIPSKNIYDYNSFDKIGSNKDIDLVYICLPNALHKEMTIRAAKAGKHVIVEKPMAITAADCREMIDACQKAGVALAVGYRLHFEPYHIEIKRLGQQRVFGQVRLIEASLGYKSADTEITKPKEWRLKKALSGGGPLMNIGLYCVQSSRYVLGEEPVSVTAQFGPVINQLKFDEVEESITWQLNFPSGAVCNSSSSYSATFDRFFAAADEGSFELSPGLSYGPFAGKTSNGPLSFPTINQQTVQTDSIAAYILQGADLPAHISGEEGFKDMKVLQAIYQAANSGEKVLIQ